MTEPDVITCNNCGKDLSNFPVVLNEKIPCPDCGSLNRTLFVTIEEKLQISESMNLKVKDSTGFVKQESTTKQSHSGKTGRSVIITKEVDRTNSDHTTFHHKVKELDEHGILSKTIHEHKDKHPAKRRPHKKE